MGDGEYDSSSLKNSSSPSRVKRGGCSTNDKISRLNKTTMIELYLSTELYVQSIDIQVDHFLKECLYIDIRKVNHSN